MPINNPTDHGWKEEDGRLIPIWTTLPFATGLYRCCMYRAVQYQSSVQVHEGKVEVHTSLQMSMQNVVAPEKVTELT